MGARNAANPAVVFLVPNRVDSGRRDSKLKCAHGVMRPRTMWPLVVAAYRGLPDFQRERVRVMGFGPILEIEPFFVDPPLIQVIRDRWDRVSRTFLFPWGHMVPSLEDVARITGLRVDGEAVTGVTYADYTDLTQRLLGLEPFGEGDHDQRMVGRVALLESLGLAGVRQRADELLPAFVERATGLARAAYDQDAEDTVRADRDLRRFLVFFFGKMLFTTKGDGIHCRFLDILEDLARVGRYAWGAALLAHTFADLSTGTGRETIVGGFAPFLQVWIYYYIPLGRATEVDPTTVPLARRWLPLVSTATYAFQLDVLRRHVRDYPALLVVWEPYADHGEADQPWVVSGRGLFGQDIWVHCLNEIEPLHLRLAVRALGLHQRWIDEAEPRGIGRKTRGKAKTVDWRIRFPEQFSDWHRGGQVVESDAIDSTAYLRRFQEEYSARDFMRPERDGRDTLIGQLQGQLASTEVQLAEARAALETLTEELEGALARETGTVAELTEQSRQLTELRSQMTQQESQLPRDVVELQAMLRMERRDWERQQTRWEQECSMEQGRASAYSESILATSSQHERNVQDAAAAQRSTGSQAPMGPPALPTVVDQGEAESSHRRGPTEGVSESAACRVLLILRYFRALSVRSLGISRYVVVLPSAADLSSWDSFSCRSAAGLFSEDSFPCRNTVGLLMKVMLVRGLWSSPEKIPNALSAQRYRMESNGQEKFSSKVVGKCAERLNLPYHK
ncbi:hypothetical protein Taro_023914 [Colocasia esculenta]|uniref:Aminotransferase-like plant mobile domain-containing protein n=1 Tax=Colocasia esculenta TaxID=4460 RepID=A0A843V7T5_COLES|nr:hypothetical protein [Colocasia esculenta]